MRHLVVSCFFGALVSAGCDDSAKTKLEAEAKAKAEKEATDAKEREASLAKRKEEREAKAKAEEEAKANVAAELEKLCTVPDPMPKKAPGCEQVGEAHDAFVRRVGGAEAVAAWDGGEKDREVPMTVVQCTQADSSKVALCQKNALDGASDALKDHVKEILQTCIDNYGKGTAAAAPIPKKRPG